MSVNGPMAKTLEEIALYSKTIIDQQPWFQDPKCLPIPWRAVEPKKHLKLAVCWHDGIVTPTPPVARALRETVQRLRAAGHEIVKWNPEEHKRILTLLRRLFVADGAKSIRGLLEPTNEPFRPEMPSYEESVELGVHEMWQIQAERSELQKHYLDRWNAMGGLDGLICRLALSFYLPLLTSMSLQAQRPRIARSSMGNSPTRDTPACTIFSTIRPSLSRAVSTLMQRLTRRTADMNR